tara:strand:- start:2897 stop:4300 length:1404 start_codon:yes stop_codon:yes gene_type:complete
MNKNSSIAIVAGIAIAIAVIASVLAFSGTSNDSTPMESPEQANLVPQAEKITILTSFYPYHEFTKNVAGDFANVKQFMPSGVEAHDWEPRAQEIQSLKDADVFVYNGLGMESYIENIIESGEFDNVVFLKASEGVELLKFEDDHDDHAKHDDHDDHDDHDEHAKEDDHDDHDDHAKHDDHDDHAEEFHEEIALVIEEFEEGHMTESQSIVAIEEILHEHEGDGHEHGAGMIEDIEHVLHEIEDGHIAGSEGLEEIHHLVSGEDVHDKHAKEDDHDDHDEHEEGGHDGHDHDYEFDPHIWLDPILVKQQVNVIRDGLIQVDPDNKEHYEENARIYNDKMDALDMKIGSALSSCQKDTIVPYHNAFTYLGERYDIHIMALGGMAPDSEASAAEIAEFVDFVKDNDIKVIFSEELVDPRLAEVIAEEANAQVLLFSPLEALSKDEAGTNVSYIDKMEDNLDSLKVALECQ